MKDLSLHILDIAQNSLSADANNIDIEVVENTNKNLLTIAIKDDGKGMPEHVIERVTDPYFTSRKTRKVGMGLPLFKQNAETAGGGLHIESQVGRGTTVKATFLHSHLDRPPMGDIAGVVIILVSSNPTVEWTYTHIKDGEKYVFDTREVRSALDDIPLNDLKIGKYLKEMIQENLADIGAQ